jgi:3-oxoadipate enol-lactonase
MSETRLISTAPETTLQVTTSGSSKLTLIFLHFWGGSSQTFSQVISSLSPQVRCVAIDFRGWGSSAGSSTPDAYGIQDLADDVETIITKLDIHDIILVGHSMGGKVAQLIAGRGNVNGLKGVVLIAPAPPTPLVLPTDMKEQQLLAYSNPESAEFVVRNVLTSSKLNDEVVKMLVEDMMKGNAFAKAAWPSYAMAEDILKDAKKIDVPVLVIAGREDRIETEERVKTEVVANVKGAELVVVEGSGHLLPVEAPGEVSRLIREFVSHTKGPFHDE